MALNLVDAVGILIYLLLVAVIYKKAWFYSFYSFVKFLVIFIFSLLAGLVIASYNPYSIPVTKLEQSLIIQLVIFLGLWKLISFKRAFFTVSRRVFNLDRFIFTHHISKFINIIPSLIASFFITFFLFNIAVSYATTNPSLQKEIDGSKIIKPIAYKIYFTPIAINHLKLFEGSLFKLTPPADSSSDVDLRKIADSALNDLKNKINLERIGSGLTPIFVIPSVPSPQVPIGLPTAAPPIIVTNPGGLPKTPPPSSSTPTTSPNSPQPGIPTPTTPPSNPNPGNPNLPNPTAVPTVVPTTPTPAPTPYNPPPPTTNISQIEQDIFRLTNDQRTQNGLAPYAWGAAIAAVARAHSKDMSARNFFDHVNPDGVDPFQRMRVGGVSFSYAGENIAGGPSADIMVNNWMHSPGHRANILNAGFHRIGIGVAQSSAYGLVATQDFTN